MQISAWVGQLQLCGALLSKPVAVVLMMAFIGYQGY